MANVSARRLVALTPDQAFKIAADVANYPKFIPGVTAVVVTGGPPKFNARLVVAAGPLGGTKSFTSAVEADAQARQVTATSQDGPLKALNCVWRFTPMAGSRCQAEVNIDYEFKSKLLQFGAGAVMDRAVAKVMDAFEKRGRELYPESAIPSI